MRQLEQNRKGILKAKTLGNGHAGYEINKMHADFVQDDYVSWEAPADSAITIMFPPGADPLRIGTVTLMPGAVLHVTLGLKRDYQWHADHPGRTPEGKLKAEFTYRYAIYCYKTRNFAVMNSDPEIIIEGEG